MSGVSAAKQLLWRFVNGGQRAVQFAMKNDVPTLQVKTKRATVEGVVTPGEASSIVTTTEQALRVEPG